MLTVLQKNNENNTVEGCLQLN